MNIDVMYSSKTDQWETPWEFYNALNEEFGFTLDPCANETNAKCGMYFDKEKDGLLQDWGGHTVFCNPPYGREIRKWVVKCYEESGKENTTCVMLIPARTDTTYFHEYIYNKPHVEVRFLRGRLRFGGGNDKAPFPSMVVVFYCRYK